MLIVCGGFVNDKATANYQQFDSYPSGVGSDIVEFIVKINKKKNKTKLWQKLKDNCLKVKEVGDTKPTKEDIKMYAKFSNTGVSTQSLNDWYCLLRELQGSKTLDAILDGDLKHIDNSIDFIKDSLFCEYAYLINLDTMTLDFYIGFQKEPQKENRFGMNRDKEYYPCKLAKSFPLADIEDADSVVDEMDEITQKEDAE